MWTIGRYVEILSRYERVQDLEVAAVICSWLSNGWKGESAFACHLLLEMGEHPSEADVPDSDTTLFLLFSYTNLAVLIDKCKSAIKEYGTIEDAVIARMGRKKEIHIALAELLGGKTGFPLPSNKGMFYRYSLLVYLLAYKMGVWKKIDTSTALIPCNKKVIAWARERRIIERNQIILTPRAKKITLAARKEFTDPYILFEDNA